MAWISVHEQVEGMKLRELSKAIGCSQKEALGILVSLWLWGINNADRDGVLKSAEKNDIIEALSTGLSTGLSTEKIVECLIEKQWIDDVNGTFILHDWDEWQEQWYKALDRRKYDAERKREERKNNKNSCSLENPQDSPLENPVQPSPSPSPSPNNNIEESKDSSLEQRIDYGSEIVNFRERYIDFIELVDQYFDILRTTRVSGKIADSVIYNVYKEMDKHSLIIVKASIVTIISNPSLHSKKENYFYGIMRNTKADEAAEKIKKYEKHSQQNKPTGYTYNYDNGGVSL